MYRSTIIIDDFYPDPYKVRDAVLGFDYPAPPGAVNYPGRNSRQRLRIPDLDVAVSRILDEPVAGEPRMAHGQCRITLASDVARFNVHVDEDVLWSGIVYLNLPEQCQGGTAFYRHRPTDSERAPLTPAELEKFGVSDAAQAIANVLDNDANDPAKWELVMTLPMRFNRLVLFRPWLWHAGAEGFGGTDANGRLVQLMFFKAAPGT